MSIQSEISRLNQAVSGAFSAVEDKGGTVPASKVIANLAQAIASIPSGGGGNLPSGDYAIDTGTYTPASDLSSDITITHKLGGKPEFLIVYADEVYYAPAMYTGYLMHEYMSAIPFSRNSVECELFRVSVTSYSGADVNAFNGAVTAGENYVNASTFEVICSSSFKLKGGMTYKWIVIKRN